MLLGDAIASVTSALGIPHCDECEARRAWLNDLDSGVRSLFHAVREQGAVEPGVQGEDPRETGREEPPSL